MYSVMTLVTASGDIFLKSVLIATDFWEASEKALRHALAIARHYGAKLYLVHVVASLGFFLVGPDAVTQVPRSFGWMPVNWRTALFKAAR